MWTQFFLMGSKNEPEEYGFVFGENCQTYAKAITYALTGESYAKLGLGYWII